MEITENDIKKMREKGLAVCIPCYGGMIHAGCHQSVMGLQQLFMQLGIPLQIHYQINESLISRARAYLADSFLRSDERFSHMIFIDADIQFDPKDILYMYYLDKQVIGGAYPLKTIKWENIEKGIKINGINNFKHNEYQNVTGSFVFNLIEGTTQMKLDEPVEVKYVGTGLMMIKREVFHKFTETYPELIYTPDHRGTEHFSGDRKITMFFPCEIDPVSNRYLSEDYAFSERVRKMGIPILMCAHFKTKHWGSYPFEGDIQKIAEYVKELS